MEHSIEFKASEQTFFNQTFSRLGETNRSEIYWNLIDI